MKTAKNALIEIESAQTLIESSAMADSGDHKIFKFGTDHIVSVREGYEAVIRPNGVATSVNMISPAVSGGNNLGDVAEFTAYIGGNLVTVAADTDIVFTRGSSNGYRINSVCADAAGVISVVVGTESTAFSGTRGAAGGPPTIPVEKIEIGQVRFTSITAAPVLISEIYQSVEGGYCERYDYPVWDTDTIGEGDKADDADRKYAFTEFVAALPVIHGASAASAATAAKKVFAQYHTPVFMTVAEGTDFKPAEESTSVSSKQIYRKTIGSESKSLGAGGFTTFLSDGITDLLSRLEGERLTIRFYPNINQSAYSITQGVIGLQTSFPASENISAAVTIAASKKTVRYSA